MVFAVNGLMAYLALRTWGGLETPESYRTGIHYNNEISAAQAQAESGWTLALQTSPRTPTGGQLGLQITRPADTLPPVRVTARISRAVTEIYDQEITLTKSGETLYTAPLDLPLAGQWAVDFSVEHPQGPRYRLKTKIFIPAQDNDKTLNKDKTDKKAL